MDVFCYMFLLICWFFFFFFFFQAEDGIRDLIVTGVQTCALPILIRRVYKRYGDEHVGLVCSFPTYRLRSTVREIGKALDLPPGEIEQVAKLSDSRTDGLSDEIERLPGFAGRRNAPLWKELCELAEEIAGLPRHVSQHVGGMIISSRPLVEI